MDEITINDLVNLWIMLNYNSGNSGTFPIMATNPESIFRNDTQINGIDAVLDRIKKASLNNQDLELGPLPLMPYFWPSDLEGIEVPDSIFSDPGNKPATGEDLLALPYTFVRRTQYIDDISISFHNGASDVKNDIKDSQGKWTASNGKFDQDSYGWFQIAYDNFPNGTEHSCWLIWINGQPTTIMIEHRDMENGMPKDSLSEYWKPKDIYQNVIKPRMDLGMSIDTFTARLSLGRENLQIYKNGIIPKTKTPFIQACTYLWPTESFLLQEASDLSTFTAQTDKAVPDNNIGLVKTIWDAAKLPNLAWIIGHCKQNGILSFGDFLAQYNNIDTYQAKCMHYFSEAGVAIENVTECNNQEIQTYNRWNPNDAIFPNDPVLPAIATSRNGIPVLQFDKDIDRTIYFDGLMNEKYDGEDLYVDIDWNALTAITGTVQWLADFAVLGPDKQDYDSYSFSGFISGGLIPTNPVAGKTIRTSIRFTNAWAGGIAAGDHFRLSLTRSNVSGSNMNDDAFIVAVKIRR